MASILHYNPNRARSSQAAGRVLPKVEPGDVGTWTNPNTGSSWPELEVRYVYRSTGALLVEGCFGRMGRDGTLVREQKTCLISQFRVDVRKAERV